MLLKVEYCACRFSDLNLPPKNWTFPCAVANLGAIKVPHICTDTASSSALYSLKVCLKDASCAVLSFSCLGLNCH